MVELYQLEQLTAVARCGTLSQAALELHISQPALSQTMQKLEEELQVPLFERKKNRITLHPNGLLAVQCAHRVLEEARSLTEQVRAFDQSRRTIRLGACAPVPLGGLVPLLSQLFPGMTVVSEMAESEVLLERLLNGGYQLIVLPEAVEHSGVYCQRYGEEHLCLSLPPEHPLAACRQGVHLRDIDGETMLLYSDIGFWRQWSRQMLPSTHFLLQQNMQDFNTLVEASALPAFASDVMLRRSAGTGRRVHIPILDQEAHATYYCLCRLSDRRQLAALFQEIEAQGL